MNFRPGDRVMFHGNAGALFPNNLAPVDMVEALRHPQIVERVFNTPVTAESLFQSVHLVGIPYLFPGDMLRKIES